jgi:membrane associated rhomboid family serine protease
MGLADRDYMQSSSGRGGERFGGVSPWTISVWLIVINVAAFLIDSTLQIEVRRLLGTTPQGVPVVAQDRTGLLFHFGSFSFLEAVRGLQVWRFLTCQFLHADLMHLLGNMMGIYFFGPMIESRIGRRKFLAFYLLCGFMGPIGFMAMQAINVLPVTPDATLIGASAGVFGILIAGAFVAPRAWVQLIFPPIPIQLRTLAWLLIAFAAYTVFTRGNNAGGEAAHLGGAALGWYLIRNHDLLNFAERLGRRRPRMRIRYD